MAISLSILSSKFHKFLNESYQTTYYLQLFLVDVGNLASENKVRPFETQCSKVEKCFLTSSQVLLTTNQTQKYWWKLSLKHIASAAYAKWRNKGSFFSKKGSFSDRGVSRNLLRGGGQNRGSAVKGQSSSGWGQSRQKPETHAAYSTEQSYRSSLFRIRLYFEKNFQLQRGDTHPYPPWLRHCSRIWLRPLQSRYR